MNQSLIATCGFFAGAIVVMVDGPRSIWVGLLFAGVLLAPAAATVAGPTGALIPVIAAALAMIAGRLAHAVALRGPGVPGLDPTVAVVAPRTNLFGPRSVRAAGAVLGLVTASWVSLNAQIGDVVSNRGAVFSATFLWAIGGIRVLRARAVVDLALGAALVALAGAVSWLLELGQRAVPEALMLASAVPIIAAVSGWLTGRHHRRKVAVS